MVGDGDVGGGCASVEAGGTWNISACPSQFCCEPKVPLKFKMIFFQKASSVNNRLRWKLADTTYCPIIHNSPKSPVPHRIIRVRIELIAQICHKN